MQHPENTAGFNLFVRRPQGSNLLPALLALLAGGLQAASVAWPLKMPMAPVVPGLQQGQTVWWAQTVAMVVLVRLLMSSSGVRQAAWRGWLFALAWLSLTFAWLFTSMHTYGGLPAALAALAVLALAGALAVYYALACGSFWALAPINKALSAILFALLWLLAELARGQWLTGFGWGAIAYAQLDGPLADLIGWCGAYGVGFAAALMAALLAMQAGPASGIERSVAGGLLLALLALAIGLPAPAGRTLDRLSVSLLQGNIAQEEKFQPNTGVPAALRWYGEQLQSSRSALTITPETALALLPGQLPEGYWASLQQRFASGEQAALVGMPLGSHDQGYTNSVVGFKPGQSAAWRYDKHHLVPFGEFIPPLFRWFTQLMNIPLGDFNRGTLPQPTFDWRGQRLATTICYENLFSEELATQFSDPATAPTILVNISNLGWFGEHLAMDQHLQIARMRTLEFDRPFLLATNTGQSAIVDHQGRIRQSLVPHTAAVLSGEVQRRSGITPYAFWASRWGLWPLWWAATLGLLLIWWGGRPRRLAPPGSDWRHLP